MGNNMKHVVLPRGNGKKTVPAASSFRKDNGGQVRKLLMPGSVAASIEGELAKLRVAVAAVQQIRLSAQRELEMAKQMRTEALKYQQEMETKARSQAQQLILRTRLATQKEIEELVRNTGAEIQKLLADIRVIRITAQEELAAQRKFTNAARISSLSHEVQKETEQAEEKWTKQLACKK